MANANTLSSPGNSSSGEFSAPGDKISIIERTYELPFKALAGAVKIAEILRKRMEIKNTDEEIS